MKKINRYILVLVSVITFGFLTSFVPAVVAESPKQSVCKGVELSGSGCDPQPGETSVKEAVGAVINILSIIVGLAAVIMIIVSGLKFIISSGDSTAIASARNGLLYAVIGLIVAALAQVLVRYVIKKFA